MENNSQESKQNTNYQPQNQGQAYPQPQNAPPQNQIPIDPQLQLQKSLLYQQAENLEQKIGQNQSPAYSPQNLDLQMPQSYISQVNVSQEQLLQEEESVEQTQPQELVEQKQEPVEQRQSQLQDPVEQKQLSQPQAPAQGFQTTAFPQSASTPAQQPFQLMQQPYAPYQPMCVPQNVNINAPLEEPISFSDWMITFLLLCIPVLNIVFLILWAFGSRSKKSKENYAKAALVWVFIWSLIGFTLFTVFWGIINGTL